MLLDAQVTEFDGGVLVNWDVRDDVFAPGVIDAMFAHRIDELRRLADNDDAWDVPRPSALPASQRAVREACNARTAEPSGEALHHGFFRRAEAQPDAPAVYATSGDLSYAQLRDQSFAVAAALSDFGIRPRDTVAVMGPKNAEQIPAVVGILAFGGVYLPIGVDQPRDRAARIFDMGRVRAALVWRRAGGIGTGANPDGCRGAAPRYRQGERIRACHNRSHRAGICTVHLGVHRGTQRRRDDTSPPCGRAGRS